MGVLAGLPFYVIFFEELFLVESSLVPKSVVVVISAYGFDFVGGVMEPCVVEPSGLSVKIHLSL